MFKLKLLVMHVALIASATLSGCATIVDQARAFPVRHPCGNVWDICPGDSKVYDTLELILGKKGEFDGTSTTTNTTKVPLWA